MGGLSILQLDKHGQIFRLLIFLGSVSLQLSARDGVDPDPISRTNWIEEARPSLMHPSPVFPDFRRTSSFLDPTEFDAVNAQRDVWR